MTHPITPSPELVQQWRNQAPEGMGSQTREMWIAARAAQWGADQELEACCEWLSVASNHGLGWDLATILSGKLRAARRPKSQSLKEEALHQLEAAERLWPADWSAIRRALNQLPDNGANQ
jgi:hypothetical protein